MTVIRTSCAECHRQAALDPDDITLIRSGNVVTYGWGPCADCGTHTIRTANSECLSLLAGAGKRPTVYVPPPRPALPPLTEADRLNLLIDLHTVGDPLAELR